MRVWMRLQSRYYAPAIKSLTGIGNTSQRQSSLHCLDFPCTGIKSRSPAAMTSV